jgi:mono/diheme cytochrome c family protein
MVNKHIGYITSAHLLLISVALGGWLVSKIPFNSSHPESDVDIEPVKQKSLAPLSPAGAKGKVLFQTKCASCHALNKDMVGPSLASAIDDDHWSDRKQLYKWIRNPQEFMKTDSYTRALRDRFGSMMQAFPDITDEEINNILSYIASGKSEAID